MKLLVCGLLVFAVLQIATSQSLSNEEVMKRLRDLYGKENQQGQAIEQLKSKVEQICPGYGDRVENVTKEMENCWDEADETSETMCSILKRYGDRCTKPAIDLLQECLPERAKELPKMVVTMILSGTKYLCTADGEHIFELANPCFKSSHYQTSRCIRRIKSKLEAYAEKTPSKSEICETLSSLRSCLQSHLQVACGHPKTRESFLNFYDALRSPCEAYRYNELDFVERL